MTNIERTNERKLDYSNWRRQLKSGEYCMDLDWVEVRYPNNKLKVVALIETKFRGRETKFQKEVMLYFADKMSLPAYTVVYGNLTTFIVIDLKTNKSVKMTEQEYLNFLKTL